MLGSIFIGLSGMKAYSRGLQTISNNVSNLNSPGFKASSVRFSDAFNRGGGGPLYAGLGSNAAGGGVRYSSATIDFTAGDLRETESGLDLVIDGRGFLMLLDGDKTYYARTGSFKLDEDGYLVDQTTGYRLAIRNEAGQAEAVNIESRLERSFTKTSKITFADNLSTTATTASEVKAIKVIDANGGEHLWSATFTRDSTTVGDWTVVMKDEKGVAVGDPHTLKTNGMGTLDQTTTTFSLLATPTGSPSFSVLIDLTGITNNSSGTSTLSAKADGYPIGELRAVTFDEDGQIKLDYTNGENALAGFVAMADFRDPSGLTQVSGGLFRNDQDLEVKIRVSGKGGLGALKGGQMEASNVDLSQEFGDLILVQRGYQASSQVVSISNDMIQQLFGIRGQG